MIVVCFLSAFSGRQIAYGIGMASWGLEMLP